MNRMRTLLPIVALAMIAPRATRAQQQVTPNAAASQKSAAIDDATRSQVLAARDAIRRAWFGNDTVALARLLPRSTTAGEGGGWETRDEIVEALRRSASSGLRLVAIRFDDTRMHGQGNVVVVFSNYTMELESQGRAAPLRGVRRRSSSAPTASGKTRSGISDRVRVLDLRATREGSRARQRAMTNARPTSGTLLIAFNRRWNG